VGTFLKLRLISISISILRKKELSLLGRVICGVGIRFVGVTDALLKAILNTDMVRKIC